MARKLSDILDSMAAAGEDAFAPIAKAIAEEARKSSLARLNESRKISGGGMKALVPFTIAVKAWRGQPATPGVATGRMRQEVAEQSRIRMAGSRRYRLVLSKSAQDKVAWFSRDITQKTTQAQRTYLNRLGLASGYGPFSPDTIRKPGRSFLGVTQSDVRRGYKAGVREIMSRFGFR